MRGTEQQATRIQVDFFSSLLCYFRVLDDAHAPITLRQDPDLLVRVAFRDDFTGAIRPFTATKADEFGIADLDEGVVDAVLVDVLY